GPTIGNLASQSLFVGPSAPLPVGLTQMGVERAPGAFIGVYELVEGFMRDAHFSRLRILQEQAGGNLFGRPVVLDLADDVVSEGFMRQPRNTGSLALILDGLRLGTQGFVSSTRVAVTLQFAADRTGRAPQFPGDFPEGMPCPLQQLDFTSV